MQKKAASDGKPGQERGKPSSYAAMTLDSEYRVCTYGDAASSLFGFSEVSMLGKPVGIILPDLQARLGQNVSSAALPLSELKMDAMHASGDTFPVMVGMREHNAHSNCRHLLMVRNLRDIKE